MPFFGLSKPWIAKLNTSTNTYSEALKVGEAVSTNVSPNYQNAKCYGDNREVEDVTEFVNAAVTLGVTRIPTAAGVMMFGHTTAQDGSETSNSEDTAGYLGYGFITAEMIGGVKKYRACILLKVKFTEGEEGYQTKGEQITFVTPTINGTAVALADGDWRKKSPAFDTEADADAWIQEMFNVETTSDDEEETDHVYTEAELNEMTVSQIEELATELGYEIGSGNKAEKIAAFLAAQAGTGTE